VKPAAAYCFMRSAAGPSTVEPSARVQRARGAALSFVSVFIVDMLRMIV
jgi:hypothetical protein